VEVRGKKSLGRIEGDKTSKHKTVTRRTNRHVQRGMPGVGKREIRCTVRGNQKKNPKSRLKKKTGLNSGGELGWDDPYKGKSTTTFVRKEVGKGALSGKGAEKRP